MEQRKGLIASGSILRHERPPILNFLKEYYFFEEKRQPKHFRFTEVQANARGERRNYRIREHKYTAHIYRVFPLFGKKMKTFTYSWLRPECLVAQIHL
jgi:hypothetical protein